MPPALAAAATWTLLLLLGAHAAHALHDPARFVDPLIGTLNGGHVCQCAPASA